jgi:predicted AlkP superfamily pyrophosphatase or phosphodiesterase
MNDKTKVVFILIDALRSDYITKKNTPFLYDFSQKNRYYKQVTQSRSFCERAEIFTGLSPRESGYFTAIGFSPEDSPFKNMKWLNMLALFDKLLPKNRFYNAYKNRLNKFLKRQANGMSSYLIPLNIMKFFNLTEDKYDFRADNGFDGQDNIFKDCKQNDLNIFYDSFTSLNFTKPSNDELRLKEVENNISNDYNLYLVYQSVIDSLGHNFGPDSQELKSGLQKLDKRLEEFYNKIISHNKDTKFIFLGDHGMTKVHTILDIEKELINISKKYNLKLGKDFVYFLDSTIFRIWYLNDSSKKIFEKELSENKVLASNGLFVDENIAREQEIPFPDRRYGDTLWMANLGVLIFPDFFHDKKPYKGMHGYEVDDTSSKGTCIVSSENSEFIKDINLTDVYLILKNELAIK